MGLLPFDRPLWIYIRYGGNRPRVPKRARWSARREAIRRAGWLAVARARREAPHLNSSVLDRRQRRQKRRVV